MKEKKRNDKTFKKDVLNRYNNECVISGTTALKIESVLSIKMPKPYVNSCSYCSSHIFNLRVPFSISMTFPTSSLNFSPSSRLIIHGAFSIRYGYPYTPIQNHFVRPNIR